MEIKTYEDFVKMLEWLVTSKESDLTKYIHDRALIARTIRLVLHNPEYAQQYLDNGPKATLD